MSHNLKTITLLFGTILFFSFSNVFGQGDSPPKPYGGNMLMKEFICEEMIYPETALENKTEGTVSIQLTVLTDGKRVNYRVKESVSPELDKEALRICKLIIFYPAVASSNTIIADVVIPVKFNVKKYERNCKQRGFRVFETYDGAIDTSMKVFATLSLQKRATPVFEDPTINFSSFIVENLKYPDPAFTQNIEGTVELSFVVETSGRISNIEVIQPLGGGCTEEAIHLMKQIMWSPGIYKNMAVRSFMKANIIFSLDNSSGHQYLPNNNNTTM